MAVCLAFPPAGNRVRRERYGELIDIMKVMKEKEKKVRREREIIEKERKERRVGKERSKEKEVQKCDHIVKRHSELGRKRGRDAETETSVKGSSSLSSEVTTASSYDNYNNEIKTTRKRQLPISEEIAYKHLLLEDLFPPQLLDAAALPPVNLDWLYPNTTKKTKTSEEDDERRAEKRQRRESILSSCSSSWSGPHAQYLHEVEIYALPYVLPF